MSQISLSKLTPITDVFCVPALTLLICKLCARAECCDSNVDKLFSKQAKCTGEVN